MNETLFTLAAALNGCGYDAGLDNSLPLRQAVRGDLTEAVKKSAAAAEELQAFCQFQREHAAVDPSRDVAQYVSLGIELSEPPDFAPVIQEADLPPEAARVLGSISLLKRLYRAAGLHGIWQKHQAEYQALVDRYHDAVAKTIIQTDVYLKLQAGLSTGRNFVICLEPLLSPAEVNSRNYGDNFFLVVSPAGDGALHLPEIRHSYLHYVLEPLARKHGASMQRLDSLLQNVQRAPMQEMFKHDISLMVTESLIRAIEARTGSGKAGDPAQLVQHSVEEGFTLTRYFYDALVLFEKDSTGLATAYGSLLYNIDLDREKKRAASTRFAPQAEPEILTSAKPSSIPIPLLDRAERMLAGGDPENASKLALEAVNDPKSGQDQGRAFFILARAATLGGDMQGASRYFQLALDSAHDPRTLAWSHIYLGRILDLKGDREQALVHYRAALQSGDAAPDTKTAAENGVAGPYTPPTQRQ